MLKQIKQVCKCENCGNEAEMIVTCELIPVEDEAKKAEGVEKQEKKLPPKPLNPSSNSLTLSFLKWM